MERLSILRCFAPQRQLKNAYIFFRINFIVDRSWIFWVIFILISLNTNFFFSSSLLVKGAFRSLNFVLFTFNFLKFVFFLGEINHVRVRLERDAGVPFFVVLAFLTTGNLFLVAP